MQELSAGCPRGVRDMGSHLLKQLISLMITLLFLGTLLTSVGWYIVDSNNAPPRQIPPQKKSLPKPTVPPPPPPPLPCVNCSEDVKKATKLYFEPWKKQEGNYKKFRSELRSKCQGLERAIITQANTPQGSKIVYDGEKKKSMEVNAEVFSTFIKENPFPNKTWDTCAIVGNGGILANSRCGEMIDSAQFVIRCNLPPLSGEFKKDVGTKTHLVTANPSIFVEKYFSLQRRRRPFAESVGMYGNALLLLPAFSFNFNTPISMRVYYTIDDFQSAARAVYFNPEYLRKLSLFWRSRGLKSARLSTGLMVASLALEVCSDVHLYGYWPFELHPHSLQTLTNHYYDDRKAKVKIHAMPTEFNLLLQLHRQGVLRLHLDDCEAADRSEEKRCC